jgi:hypothetical protein
MAVARSERGRRPRGRGIAAPAGIAPHVAIAAAAVPGAVGRCRRAGPAPDRPAVERARDGLVVGRLAPGQAEAERPALAVAADVDLRREAASRAAQGLALTPRRGRSGGAGGVLVAADDGAVDVVQGPVQPAASVGPPLRRGRARSHTPLARQRWKAPATLDRGPHRSGGSRHGAPVPSTHRMPPMVRP